MLFSIIQHLLSIVLPTQAYAQEESSGVYDGVAGIDWILVLLQNVLSVALRFIGITALVMLVVGSIKMSTSGGDPKAAQSAKSTIGMAIGGLVVATLAWLILEFISEVTGVSGITKISIPTLDF
jgi:glucose uptake protein GlcU